MLVIPPAGSPSAPVPADLLSRLRCCGDLDVHVVVDVLAGERDVRLTVHRDHPPVTVELLCEPDDGASRVWHAVRIARDGRCVWRGPHPDRGVGALLRFIDDLLRLQPGELARRYRDLG